MKRLFLFVFAALAFAACEQAPIEEQSSTGKLGYDAPDTIYASLDDDATRTYVEQGKYLRWHAGDEISFFPVTYNMQYQFQGETGDNNGAFKKLTTDLITGNELNNNYAVYPYKESTAMSDEGVISFELPAEQGYAEDSFGLGANTMVAITSGKDDNILRFKNACGYLKLNLYGEDVCVKSIMFRGNNDEKIAGAATITAIYGNDPVVAMNEEATTTITLDCGDGVVLGTTEETATAFWFVIPATTFEEGFTVTVTDTEGGVFEKSTSSSLTIERNHIQPMKALEAEFNELTQPNNEIWYTSTDGEIVNPYYANRFGATMVSNTYENGKGVIRCGGAITKIDVEAFMNCSRFTSMSLPEGVWTINEDAFSGCSNLRKITLPKSLRLISYAAMHTCGVSEIHISDLEAYCNIDFLDKSISTNYDLFVNGELLTHLIFPESNNIVGYRNFIRCRSLTDVYIHDNVSCIESDAFNQCVNISNLYIGNNVKKIYPSSFLGCSSLSEVTIPESVQEIGNSVFRSCSNLKSVYCKPLTPPVAFDWSDSDEFEWRTFENIATDAVIYVPAESVDLYKSASGWSDYANAIVGYDFENGAVVE